MPIWPRTSFTFSNPPSSQGYLSYTPGTRARRPIMAYPGAVRPGREIAMKLQWTLLASVAAAGLTGCVAYPYPQGYGYGPNYYNASPYYGPTAPYVVDPAIYGAYSYPYGYTNPYPGYYGVYPSYPYPYPGSYPYPVGRPPYGHHPRPQPDPGANPPAPAPGPGAQPPAPPPVAGNSGYHGGNRSGRGDSVGGGPSAGGGGSGYVPNQPPDK